MLLEVIFNTHTYTPVILEINYRDCCSGPKAGAVSIQSDIIFPFLQNKLFLALIFLGKTR